MKLESIIALFTLIVMVKGAWWAAAVQPVILTLGAVLGTIDKDVLDIQAIEWRNLLPFINKQDAEVPKDAKKQDEKEPRTYYEEDPEFAGKDAGFDKIPEGEEIREHEASD